MRMTALINLVDFFMILLSFSAIFLLWFEFIKCIIQLLGSTNHLRQGNHFVSHSLTSGLPLVSQPLSALCLWTPGTESVLPFNVQTLAVITVCRKRTLFYKNNNMNRYCIKRTLLTIQGMTNCNKPIFLNSLYIVTTAFAAHVSPTRPVSRLVEAWLGVWVGGGRGHLLKATPTPLSNLLRRLFTASWFCRGAIFEIGSHNVWAPSPINCKSLRVLHSRLHYFQLGVKRNLQTAVNPAYFVHYSGNHDLYQTTGRIKINKIWTSREWNNVYYLTQLKCSTSTVQYCMAVAILHACVGRRCWVMRVLHHARGGRRPLLYVSVYYTVIALLCELSSSGSVPCLSRCISYFMN